MTFYVALTVASLKMYFRNWHGVFWSLFFPLVFLVILGFINFGGFSPPDVGVVDLARSADSERLIALLRGGGEEDALDLKIADEKTLATDLDNGDIDLILTIPAGFGREQAVSDLQIHADERKPEQRAYTLAVINSSLRTLFTEFEQIPPEYVVDNRFSITETSVEVGEEEFSEFLVPGIAAMAIMQGGIFGVVFSLVRFRAQGVLRRLYATPIGANHFLVGQVITRLSISIIQAYILLVLGGLVLGVSIGGSIEAWIALTVMAVMGGAMFISLGLAISGWATTEDTAAPVSNLITMPMMFLSGVFFPVDALPDALASVVRYFPLKFLADGIRSASLDGATLLDLGPEMLGMAIWTAVIFALAMRVFKWDDEGSQNIRARRGLFSRFRGG